MTKPTFSHDCDSCKFLGAHEGQDLYVCETGTDFVARYGDEDYENKSMDLDLLRSVPKSAGNNWAHVARKLARNKS